MDLQCTNSEKPLKYFELCRTCMSHGNELKSLFIDNKIIQKSLCELLFQVTGLVITESDGLPSNICTNCISLAENSLQFKEMCRESDLNYRKGFIKESTQTFNCLIKKESESDHPQNFIKENIKPYVGLYQCAICCVSFYNCTKLKEHVKNSHNEQYESKKHINKSKYFCSACSKPFRSKSGLSFHYKKCEKNIVVKEEVVSDNNSDSDTPLAERLTNFRDTEEDLLLMKSDLVEQTDSNCVEDDNSFFDCDDKIIDFIYDNIKIEPETFMYNCGECDMKFTNKDIYDAHMKTVHADKRKRKQSTKILAIYESIHDAKLNSPKRLKCTECRRTFSNNEALTLHIKRHEKKSMEVHKCDICQREYKRAAHLENHMLTHSTGNGFKCSLCPKIFSKEENLMSHMENHKFGKKHQCPHCEKGFNMLSTLKDHIRTHTGEKPFLCSLCGRGFSQSTNLKNHVRRHQGNKPFNCTLCTQTFVSKGELEAHMRKHSGAHPFVCDECGAGFTTSGSLVKHKRIHTGERPYTCDFCPMRFAALSTMKNHKRTHTGEKPYKCQHCDKAFVQKNDLVMHTRTHTGERPYVCSKCGHAFRQNSALKTHLLKIHGC